MNKNFKQWLFILAMVLLLFCLIFIFEEQDSLQPSNFPLRQNWTAKLNARILNISVSPHGNIIVQTSSMLYSLDAKTGETLWKYDLSWQGSAKSPCFNNNAVYLVNHGLLLSINEQSGRLMWKQPLPRTNEWVTDASEKVVLVNQVSEYIVAFDANTGKYLWQQPADRGEIQAYIDNDVVYIPGYSMRSFDWLTGIALWSNDDLRTPGYVAYKDGVLYSLAGAYDLRNHKEVWQSASFTKGIVRFTVIDETVFIMDSEYICAKRVQDGTLRWCSNIQYGQIPSILNKVVYIFNGNHRKITAANLLTGDSIGDLVIVNMNIFTIDNQLMAASSEKLYFSSGSTIFAFGQK